VQHFAGVLWVRGLSWLGYHGFLASVYSYLFFLFFWTVNFIKWNWWYMARVDVIFEAGFLVDEP
jgi:hypothetical protein